ncbi:DinB family protein [Paucisalibacillus sp. EB02]|uniref:DinB family protein n=1 Tax=Paucisalibacillus sp. EB02 TaxID=1347087 RepID=UPI0005A78909|nr:DinB family protein [Paucisalibacillus sp. EB02]
MNFNLYEAIEVLERTPKTLEYFLSRLSDDWLQCHEGEGTWNASQIVDHLIEGDKTDWIPRVESIILTERDSHFPPYDRFSHLQKPERTIEEKLEEFKVIRAESLEKLKTLIDSESNFDLTGIHPEFGEVTLKQLLSTWVVHDLTHIAQIVRVMANRYRTDVGPWVSYLGILK